LAELKRTAASGHKLVLVGLNTLNIDLGGLAESLGVGNDVIHHAYVADCDLAPLYSGAAAFVLPYSYESAASLTLLEAQAAGAPVITTDTPGLREVAGDAALFLPGVDVSTIASAMARIAGDPGLRETLSKHGLQNAARYSWRACSTQMLDILYEAGSRHSEL
jgi:glycosyltransferase involved in cell wall biosynthesis